MKEDEIMAMEVRGNYRSSRPKRLPEMKNEERY